ncbi:MAG TPA: hypothetical protein VMZ28_18240 [Kofleriaceae bacterium]|nr:hypothetical protein [Kofleriaceae bacterium]
MRPSYIRSGAVLLLCAALGGCAKGESDHGGGGGADAGRLPDAGPRPDAGPDFDSGPTGGTPVTLTQSTSMAITADNSVACTDTDTGFNTEASYFRLFDLAAEGITTPLEVSQVSFGIETATGAGGNQPATVNLYALTGAFTNANLATTAGTASVSVADQTSTVLAVPITGTIPVGSKLVVELTVPDGAEGNALYVGSNAAGESGPTYVRDGCGGADEPTPLADLDVAGMHWVLSVDATK